jgi:predicted PurR-regulated permease PerM
VIVHFCIVMFLLFYMLADGKQILERIQKIIPLKDEEENQFFDRLQKVIDALVMNTFLIGIIEGTYGAVLFAIVGIPSPFFWGLLMSLFSIIPFLGANTILVPAAIIEFLLGNFWKGLIILIFGVGAVFIDQHIIKNRLDGSRSGMHPAIVFLACFGGIISLGLVGFLAGPVIAALFLVAWQQFANRYQQAETPTPTDQNQL